MIGQGRGLSPDLGRKPPRLSAPCARQIILSATERRQLKQIAYSRTAPYQLVIRVRIVLDAAHGYSNATIARRRGVHIDTVRLWRGRYDSERGVKSLADRAPADNCVRPAHGHLGLFVACASSGPQQRETHAA
ncbi:helix-turn-helix domain-containing protein [Planotetraspora sp. GP83]|uniref:helix-turn-helix domain-containing protein n=1 Tax=Planotetraspora sp. GP83 TaxID=3156264 RepID=UPI003514AF3B